MPSLPLGRSAYERIRGALPRLPVVNFIIEKSPTEDKGLIFQSRLGLVNSQTVGTGPVHATLARDGVLDGSRITVSGGEVYQDETLIGVINVVGPVSIAGDKSQVVITGGGDMVHWDGSTFSTVSFPDGAPVRKVVQLGGYFLAVRADVGFKQRWYFSALGDGTSWDGLDYAAAENEPDALLDVVAVGDGLVMLGSRSTEFWAKTGNADLPFQAIQQRVFEVGVLDTGCAVAEDNTHFQIGHDGIVYRAGNVPEPVSDDGHTADILGSSERRMYLVKDERHKLLLIRLDSKTLVLDVTSGLWSEFACSGRANFRGYCADETVIGDDEDGTIWAFEGYLDDGGPMERQIAGGFPIDGGSVRIGNLRLRVEVGQATELSGTYSEPVIEMRMSDDLGRTWSEWEAESLGEQGDYRNMPEWRNLGLFDFPGAIFEFRVSDPVSVRISGAYVNEAGSGRAR